MIVVQRSGGRSPMTFGTWTSRERAERQAARWRRTIERRWKDEPTRPKVFVQSICAASTFETLLDAEISFCERHPDADELIRNNLDEDWGDGEDPDPFPLPGEQQPKPVTGSKPSSGGES